MSDQQFSGAAVAGLYGVGLEPGVMSSSRLVCPRGTVLGKDGLCYNKIANKDRKWPKGRRPLLTGGDMRAISIAARAGKRLTSTTARLRKMGMMPPLPKARKKAATRSVIPGAGVHVVNVE